MPGAVTAEAEPRRRETVAAFLRRTGWARRHRRYGWQFKNGLPTVAVLNGQPLFRADWRRTIIRAGDRVEFWSRPYGGGGSASRGGKQIGGLIALIAVAALAIAAPYALAGLSPLLGPGTLGGALTAGAIGAGGGLRVNALQ